MLPAPITSSFLGTSRNVSAPVEIDNPHLIDGHTRQRGWNGPGGDHHGRVVSWISEPSGLRT